MIGLLKRYLSVYLVFLTSLLIVIFLYFTIRSVEKQKIIEKNSVEALERTNAIKDRILENLSTLKLIQAYIQKNQTISRYEFSNIVNPIIESNTSIQAIEWIPKVDFLERDSVERQTIREGYKGFFISQFDSLGNIVRAKPREYYYPVYYIEPMISNEKVFGFDISTYTFSKRNLYSAFEKYDFAFSSGLKLIQDSSDYGLVAYLPVYKRSIKNVSSSYNKEILYGFVTGVYKTSMIIRHALSRFSQDYSIQIFDKTGSLTKKRLYTYKPLKICELDKDNNLLNEHIVGYKKVCSIDVANFSWELVFIFYHKDKNWPASTFALFVGGLLSIFLTIIIYLNKRKSVGVSLLNDQLMRELKKRMQYEKELKLSEEKFSKLFYSAPLPITYIRLFDRAIFDVNNAFERIFGYCKESILGKTTYEIGLWANCDDWNNFYSIFLEKGEVSFLEVDVKTVKGDTRTCLISGNLIHLQEQDFIYTFFQDITERKKTELALKSSELKYREIFNSVNDAFFIYDVDAECLMDANRKAIETYKYSLDEFNRISLIELSSEEVSYTYQELREWYINAMKNDRSGLTEWQVKDKDGKVFWAEISIKEVFIDGRRCILSVSRDISERKRMEKLLVENEFLFRSQFNNSNLGIVIASPEKQFIRANKKYCDILGYTEEELLGKTWLEYTYLDDTNKEIPQFVQMLSGEIDSYEVDKRFIKKDKGLAYTHVSVSCFRNSDKSIYYIIAYIFDITDRIEMENKILKTIIETEESERTRFAQELHDGLGPILSSIKMYTQWMLKPGANLDQRDVLLQIENLANMSNQSVREIAFGLSPHILKDFGLIEALKSFIEKIKVNKDLPIEIYTNISCRLEETTETIIYRILIECINNSLKHSQADYIRMDLTVVDKTLNIEYQDNGIGFDLNEITDKRLGMGMYNIQNRLKSINGKLHIFSQHGEGTIIKINILL